MSAFQNKSRALIVAHYHWRSGGVRRVIDAGIGALVKAGRFNHVILIGGEHSEDRWEADLAARFGRIPLTVICEPALRYFSEQRLAPQTVERRCRSALERAIDSLEIERSLIWVHNLALARNVPFGRALQGVGSRSGIPIALHHHDFWFENRWPRWREMLAAGVVGLEEAACCCFLPDTRAAQIAINRFDAEYLNLPGRTWVPNPVSPSKRPGRRAIAATKRWIASELGDHAPVWLCATRLLRRKNLAEGLLLTRWIQPDAWFVTTAGPSSAEEEQYGNQLIDAAKRHGWKACFGLLAGRGGRHPAIEEIQCAAEASMLTSVQEGFGLAFLEAARLQVPLIARRLGNVQPDLDQLGVHVPHLYNELLIPLSLFDAKKEQRRRTAVWKKWRQGIPLACRRFAAPCPDLDATAEPFSRLTLEAQMEILRQDPKEAFSAALASNPWLKTLEPLQPASLHNQIGQILGPQAFAGRILSAVATLKRSARATEAAAVQSDLLHQRLRSEFLYPILMP
ncbi:MAG: hypothetical protein SFU53_15330 [Terrimicrobiaceae bacterium]|nr:hypothetical protein [Terrimicrobiaceae bacterium]